MPRKKQPAKGIGPIRRPGQDSGSVTPEEAGLRSHRVQVMMAPRDVEVLDEWCEARSLSRSTGVAVLVRQGIDRETEPDSAPASKGDRARAVVVETLRAIAKDGRSPTDLLADLATGDETAAELLASIAARL